MKDHKFTNREIEILQLIAKGYKNKKIAETLTLSLRTVQNHTNSMHLKSGAHNAVELLLYAVKNKYIKIK